MKYGEDKKNVLVYTIGKKAKEFCVRKQYEIVGSLSLKDVFDSSDLQKLYTFVDQSWKT
jgi:F0F1-type ATP synthase gamma subunit